MFRTACELRIIEDCGPRPTIRLTSPLWFESERLGRMVAVPSGFECDGASIPRVAMSITGWPGVRAAIIHDYLLTVGIERREADKVFREALAACGVDDGLAHIMYEAVRAYSRLVESDPQEPSLSVGA